MVQIPLLGELAVIAALGVIVTLVLSRLRLPTSAGLLAAGALVGPYGLSLVTSLHDIELIAEVGVVLLLFTIGLEFSLSRLRDIFRQVALGGLLQVGLTGALVFGVARLLGQPFGVSVFLGFAMALSSTAIVLRTLTERQELDAPHGRFIVGTLIFQDLCIVPMVLVIPLLGDQASGGLGALGWALGKAALVVALTLGLARLVVPRLLEWVVASRSRELFLMAILALCIGTAWLTSLAGLSLALGAFLGGIVVADTEHNHRAMSDILPLRDALVSIFFVALGMLFHPKVLLEQPLTVLALLAALIVGKAFVATVAALAMRFPARVAWLAGLGLAQFGEFGFVLTKLAQQHGVVQEAMLEPVLAAGILSMFLTPVMVRAAPHITAGERLLAPLERVFGVRTIDAADQTPAAAAMHDHTVIVGFGVAGTLLAQALQASGQPVVALEMNIANVRRGHSMDLPVYYGDATSAEALEHTHLDRARVMVVLVNDANAVDRILDAARRVAPDTPVLVRARHLYERAALREAGASDVVADEVEGAIEVIDRVLGRLDLPRDTIDARLREARDATHDLSLGAATPSAPD